MFGLVILSVIVLTFQIFFEVEREQLFTLGGAFLLGWTLAWFILIEGCVQVLARSPQLRGGAHWFEIPTFPGQWLRTLYARKGEHKIWIANRFVMIIVSFLAIWEGLAPTFLFFQVAFMVVYTMLVLVEIAIIALWILEHKKTRK